MIIQVKGIEQYSVSCGAVYYAVKGGSSESVHEILKCAHLNQTTEQLFWGADESNLGLFFLKPWVLKGFIALLTDFSRGSMTTARLISKEGFVLFFINLGFDLNGNSF